MPAEGQANLEAEPQAQGVQPEQPDAAQIAESQPIAEGAEAQPAAEQSDAQATGDTQPVEGDNPASEQPAGDGVQPEQQQPAEGAGGEPQVEGQPAEGQEGQPAEGQEGQPAEDIPEGQPQNAEGGGELQTETVPEGQETQPENAEGQPARRARLSRALRSFLLL